MAARDEHYERKTHVGSDEVGRECVAVEEEIAELRVAYEQYFLGLERRPPTERHDALKKRIQKLRSMFTRQTGTKFRVESTVAKYNTYDRLWKRTLQEIENGTYRRDLAKVKRKLEKKLEKKKTEPAGRPAVGRQDDFDDDDFSIDEAPPEEAVKAQGTVALPQGPAALPGLIPPAAPPIAPLVPSVKPLGSSPVPRAQSATPAASRAPAGPRSPVAPPRPEGNLSDDKLRAVYDAYVKAKRRCNEDTSKLNYEQVSQSLKKQVPELIKKHNAQSVEFKVVIKDGKAVLRAVPK